MKVAQVSLLAAALALFPSSAFADAVLSIVPPSGSIVAGQTFNVGIFVTGPTVIHSGKPTTSNVTDLDAFQFDVAFNCSVATSNPTGCQPGASLLSTLSVTEGSFLPQGGTNPTFFEPGTINNAAGEISLIGDVGLSGVTGSGTLVNITFQALGTGITSIAILANSDLQLFDSNFNPIVVDDSVTTSPNLQTFPTNQSLSASILSTPEPASGQLMLLAAAVLLGAIVHHRRRSSPMPI
ncbi:MAG TPA: cohesin domain-containing protein [Acidobacteriaceae bacterium]|jgi:hypothetical protein